MVNPLKIRKMNLQTLICSDREIVYRITNYVADCSHLALKRSLGLYHFLALFVLQNVLKGISERPVPRSATVSTGRRLAPGPLASVPVPPAGQGHPANRVSLAPTAAIM